MAVSKVIVNGVTKVDLTQDTVSSENLFSGNSAHDCAGEPVLGMFNGYDPEDGVDRDVNFIDYDGTILYSYQSLDFLEKASLPENPSHTGLVSQGWNWTFDEIEEQLYQCPGGVVNVGQMYITDDNRTRIYCYFYDQSPSIYLGFAGASSTVIDVDWGDGSQHSSVSCTGTTTVKRTLHSYPGPGSYTISLGVSGGGTLVLTGSTTYGSCILQYTSGASESSYVRPGVLDAIEKIELGNNVRLSAACFNYCRNLKTITIPSSISVSDYASYQFSYCMSLKSLTLPRGWTRLYEYFCNYCYSLEHIMIPPSVDAMNGQYILAYSQLKSITLPHGLTSLGYYALRNSSVTSIVVPSTVTSWENYVFSECRSLTTATFMHGISTIPYGIFSNCQNLVKVKIPKSVISINNQAFSNCASILSIEIPGSVTTIGNSAFSGCENLEYIYLPSSVTTFGTYLFQNDTSLRYVGIEPGATTISDHMFSNCYGMQVITIPQTVTTISTYAFYNCQGTKEYHFLSTTPPSLANTNAFGSIQSFCKIYVPYSSDHSILNAYKAATNWSTYASYMEEEPAGWRRILTTVANGGTVSVGTEFTVPNRLYGDVDFVVRRSNVDKITGDSSAPTVTIQQKHLLQYFPDPTQAGAFIYDHAEAFHSAISTRIPAGTVCKFTVNSGNATSVSTWTAGTYHFIATKGIPKGAMLCVTEQDGLGTSITNLCVEVYLRQSDAASVYSYPILEGDGNATVNLGSWATDSDCNHSDRVAWGSDNFFESNLVQILNSCTYGGRMNMVWEPKTKFDMIGESTGRQIGYLSGFPADFRAALRYCDVHNITNNVYESPDSEYTVNSECTSSCKVWLPSCKEIYGHNMTANQNSETQFPVYVGTDNAAKCLHTRTGTDVFPYFLRTPDYRNSYYVSVSFEDGEYLIPASTGVAIAPMAVLG